MKNKVLIFPSGAENALEVNEAIRYSVHIEVIPGSSRKDYSELMYENSVEYLPFLNEDNFISELNKIIKEKTIKFIFPTHDTAALFLTENQNKIDAYIISADYKTNFICRYKKETFNLLKNEFFCPKIYFNIAKHEEYPLFAKPNVGQGSQGIKKINNIEEHIDALKDKDLIYTEYLPGNEYTIDCFTDRHGDLLFSGIRKRAQIKMGISFKSYESSKLEVKAKEIAEVINSKLSFRGLWFFQLKEDKHGDLKLLEVSTRVAGTMGYFRHKGVNLPLFSVYDALNMDVEIHKNCYKNILYRTTTNKYKYDIEYDKVYIDFDDTIIINDKVNKILLSFIYQCKNNHIKLFLITKHAYDIYDSLEKYCISPYLFDKIIELEIDDDKWRYINPDKSIFIDNFYKERKKVREKLNIPCFDVDFVESLIIK